jgi:ubiquitin-protein ligase E3 C
MFDGSYRSKRTINLSANSKRKAALTRASIIEQSKLAREKRLEQMLKDSSIKKIQKVYRGWKSRKVLTQQWPMTTNRHHSEQDWKCALLLPALIPLVPSKNKLLIELSTQTQVNNASTFLKRLIVSYSLEELTYLAQHTTDDDTTQNAMQILNLILTVMDDELWKYSKRNNTMKSVMDPWLYSWIHCCQTWIWIVTTITKSRTTKEKEEQKNPTRGRYIATKLLETISHMERKMNHPEFSAYLAAIILGVPMDQKNELLFDIAHTVPLFNTSCDISSWYISFFKSIMAFSSTNVTNNSGISRMMQGREIIYISNVLELFHLQTKETFYEELIVFLHEILLKSSRNNIQIRTLQCLLGLAASGSDLTYIWNTTNVSTEFSNFVENGNNNNNDDDDDEEDYDSTEDEETNKPNQGDMRGAESMKFSNSLQDKRRLQRQELQTTLKLNRLYKTNLYKVQSYLFESIKKEESSKWFIDRFCDVALTIGQGDFILTLFSIFEKTASLSEKYFDMLVSLLCMILQQCSSIQARDCAMSPLLSKLAFHPTFYERLWMHANSKIKCIDVAFTSVDDSCTMTNKLYESLICFCDIYTHQLLALDDEEFLLFFTSMNQHGSPRSVVIASDIIEMMKNILHTLYWSNPVGITDFSIDQDSSFGIHRARMLLSGTKLWNALYVRWSRLCRTSMFCNESLWCFPHLVSQTADENGVHHHSNVEYMDDDGYSTNSLMEMDETDHAVSDADNESLASAFKDPKMARILTSIPQALPFDRRAKLFSSLLAADIQKTQDETDAMNAMMMNMQRGIEDTEYTGSIKCNIRRDNIYEDSMDQLNNLGHKLKKRVQVTFIESNTGNAEAGIDGGGLFKEFIDDLIKDAFSPGVTHGDIKLPLFIETSLQMLSINTHLKPTISVLSHYQFLGRVLGKAVYESILVEPQFCLPFLNQLLGQQNTIDDLKNLDPEYHRHLTSLRRMSEEDIASLNLMFDLSVPSSGNGPPQIIELIPNGSSTPVTKENSIRYVHLVAYRRLNIETSAQTKAFLSGFRDLIPASWVKLFSPYELQKLISGDDSIKGFDVLGLKRCMQYSGGFHPDQPIIQWFWQVLEEFDPPQKRNFLKFMTSCSRQPLLGFQSLAPLPCIQQVRLSADAMNANDFRLPTSSTCMNLLKLPNYPTKEILKQKLLYAIESKSGFELS